jgi:hypothetical protein
MGDTKLTEIRRMCLKPAQAKYFMRSCLKKNPLQKRVGGVAQDVGPELYIYIYAIKQYI